MGRLGYSSARAGVCVQNASARRMKLVTNLRLRKHIGRSVRFSGSVTDTFP
jgi:hypothetical protein